MGLKDLIIETIQYISGWPKRKLVEAVLVLREKYLELDKKYLDLGKRNLELQAENDRLKKEIEDKKIKEVNATANRPSSKQPEWEEKGVGNDGKGKRKKGRGNEPRKGSGNKEKNLEPTKSVIAAVEQCDKCGKDLKAEKPLKSSNKRIIEDIPEPCVKTVVTEVILEKKFCDVCKSVVTARSELALPKSDIGLNATIRIIYMWVALCLSLPKISEYLRTFFGLKISTAGLSRQVIRLSKILKDVYEEILEDVKKCKILHGDETGWRVKAKPWWLWVFGSTDSAYFLITKSRESDVVRRVLGDVFNGVLIVDGWRAYLSLLCEQQSCLAHLLRKIRKFRKAFPELVAISRFYIKLRRIIRDGEKLQINRQLFGEEVFQRRLDRLEERLDILLEWTNPDAILKTVIKKVKLQRPRILTFVKHPEAPCHNNFAEYLIRIGVLKRKISGGSLSEEGASAYAALLSVYVTCKLRRISFPDFMKESLHNYIKTGKPMLLKDYAAAKAAKMAA
jgi:transposase